jgi:hypothetical protein
VWNLRRRIEKAHGHVQDPIQESVMKRPSTFETTDNVRHVVDSDIHNQEYGDNGCVSSEKVECRAIILALIRFDPVS